MLVVCDFSNLVTTLRYIFTFTGQLKDGLLFSLGIKESAGMRIKIRWFLFTLELGYEYFQLLSTQRTIEKI